MGRKKKQRTRGRNKPERGKEGLLGMKGGGEKRIRRGVDQLSSVRIGPFIISGL